MSGRPREPGGRAGHGAPISAPRRGAGMRDAWRRLGRFAAGKRGVAQARGRAAAADRFRVGPEAAAAKGGSDAQQHCIEFVVRASAARSRRWRLGGVSVEDFLLLAVRSSLQAQRSGRGSSALRAAWLCRLHVCGGTAVVRRRPPQTRGGGYSQRWASFFEELLNVLADGLGLGRACVPLRHLLRTARSD